VSVYPILFKAYNAVEGGPICNQVTKMSSSKPPVVFMHKSSRLGTRQGSFTGYYTPQSLQLIRILSIAYYLAEKSEHIDLLDKN
jgi:hypothetical protein